jgi:HAD superfamily hydrolase (TIGR01490 family)
MAQTAAFFDIDGTLTSANVWRGLMEYYSRRGERRLTHLAFVLVHYPLALLRPVGLIREATFRRLWGGHMPWYFRGADAAQMDAMAHWVAYEYASTVTRPDILKRLRGHLAAGDVVVLVTAAPEEMGRKIGAMWGVEHVVGSPAEMRSGRYTGRLSGPPCVDAQKAVYARRYLAEKGLDLDLAASHAYADSYSDLGLFEMVGHPVAVYPDRRLAEHAAKCGWPVLAKSE